MGAWVVVLVINAFDDDEPATAGAAGCDFLCKEARATMPPPTTAPTAKQAAWITDADGILS